MSRGRVGRSISAIFVAALCLMAASPGQAQQTSLQVTVGDTATLQLDGNPSTGYAWVADAVPAVVTVSALGYVKPDLAPGERPRLGAPQKFQFLITGVAPGTGTVVFKYARAGGEAAKMQEVSVEVVGEAPAPAEGDPLDRSSPDPVEDPGEQMLDEGLDNN